MKRKLIVFFIAMISFSSLFSQEETNNEGEVKEEKESPIQVSADIVSAYWWRGQLVDDVANIQPFFSVGGKYFSAGVFGSKGINGLFSEFDLFLSFTKGGFSLTFWDYFWDLEKSYFNYIKGETGHIYEFELIYEMKKFPLRFYLTTMTGGNDYKVNYDPDETDFEKKNFSTYFELGYTVNYKDNNKLFFFAGITPFNGMYSDRFNLVNLGIRYDYKIKITESYSLTLFSTIATGNENFNPQLIFGIKL